MIGGMRSSETLDDEHLLDSLKAATPGPPEPGVILLFSSGAPTLGVIPLERGAIEVGRGEIAGVSIDDKRMSRAHAQITFDGHTWTVRDLGSRNHTMADGQEVSGSASVPVHKLVRTGTSLFLLTADS